MNLITGATGHIGNVLARLLAQRGESVRALVMPGDDPSPLAGLPVEICNGDILDPRSLEQAMYGAQTVFHLAGMISIMPGANPQVRRVNVEGTHNVLAAAQAGGVHRLVYTSSIHAIRRIPHGSVVDEQVPYDPEHALSAYDQSKAEATLAVLSAAQHGVDAVVTCPTGVIGPLDFRASEMGHLIAQAVKGGLQFCVQGAAYDFVDVRDVAQGLIQARDHGRSGESYILSGELTTLQRLIQLAQQAAGVAGTILNVPGWLARASTPFMHLYYRISRRKALFTHYSVETVRSNAHISHAKASLELGYAPRSLAASVSDTVRWLKQRTAGEAWVE